MTDFDFFNNNNVGQDEEFPVEKNNLSLEETEEDSNSDTSDTIVVSKKKLAIIKNIIARQKEDCKRLTDFLDLILPDDKVKEISIGQLDENFLGEGDGINSETKIIEGVFDGENMIGPDGKKYSMPSNYASKSKLVEGDIMKLSILKNGTFVYKQIGPTKRKRVVGFLRKDKEGGYYVEKDDKKWKILTASVTYFKGQEGDEVVLLIPNEGESKWGAVENIINSHER